MKVSVIICTLNRSGALVNCLDAMVLSLNNAAPVEAEIIVVDNGSTDDTAHKVAAWSQHCALPFTYMVEPRRGAAKARNTGIRAARGELLVFIDDDCVASADYIKKALAYDAGDLHAVLRSGRVELGDPTDLPITIITEPNVQHASLALNTARHVNIANTFLSCNMTMRKSLVDAIGYLDERLGAGTGIPGGEDIDLAFRAYLAGYAVEYVPDMTVHHFHGRKHKAQGRKLFCNYSIGGGALLVKYALRHPNLCRQFSWDIKNAFKEMATGKNLNMPLIDFSYKHKIFYQLKGMLMFLYVLLIQRKPMVEHSQPGPS